MPGAGSGEPSSTAFGEAPYTGPGGPLAWGRAEFDLDAPDAVGERLDRDRVEVVVHAAAWTDVDGCARDPATADARNGDATGVLARACATRGVDLILISTNEVFDGKRRDGVGYGPADDRAGKPVWRLEAPRGARRAGRLRSAARGQLAIVRTAWLFGPGKPDFPAKILAAAREAAGTGEPLRVTGDEWGSPTYSVDLAEAIVELLAEDTFGGIHHVVNGLFATRADWARYVVGRALLEVEIVNVPMSTWQRDSTPPRWGVLEPTPLPSGEPLRLWPDAMADYAPLLLRETAAGGSRPAR